MWETSGSMMRSMIAVDDAVDGVEGRHEDELEE